MIVSQTLQVAGHPDIFAAGDITNIQEQKQLMKTEWHAEVIVENIISLIKGSGAQKLYKTKMEAIAVTNGKVRNRHFRWVIYLCLTRTAIEWRSWCLE